jgi:ABC-type uncharacterized transport system permease subunit
MFSYLEQQHKSGFSKTISIALVIFGQTNENDIIRILYFFTNYLHREIPFTQAAQWIYQHLITTIFPFKFSLVIKFPLIMEENSGNF